MRLRLRAFGVTIASLLFDADYVEATPEISGAATHNFERDSTPLDPDDRYRYDEEEFGFRGRLT